ncbi:MAG: hypothetical protein IT379_35360 [Deltaproteobacteria bacterium]|nr:hypothetical protein [Deltaproteobacteria bacterium]
MPLHSMPISPRAPLGTSSSRVTLLGAFLVATTFLVSGCGGCGEAEDAYCDETGCYFCDGLGCRRAETPARTPCPRGQFQCVTGVCTSLGCVPLCSTGGDTDAGGSSGDCPDGTTCLPIASATGGELTICAQPGENPMHQPGSCTTNDDCGDGAVCLDGMCADDPSDCGAASCECTTDEDCEGGRLCVEGECRAPEDTCQFNLDCGPGRLCVDARCVEGCADGTCPTGQHCESNVCVDDAPTTCATNEDCGAGRVCLDAECRESCTTSEQCGEGRFCDDGVCAIDDRPRPFCETDDDCMEGRRCVDGVCRTPCSNDEMCARFDVAFTICLADYCRTTNEIAPECARSRDCAMGQECVDAICR